MSDNFGDKAIKSKYGSFFHIIIKKENLSKIGPYKISDQYLITFEHNASDTEIGSNLDLLAKKYFMTILSISIFLVTRHLMNSKTISNSHNSRIILIIVCIIIGIGLFQTRFHIPDNRDISGLILQDYNPHLADKDNNYLKFQQYFINNIDKDGGTGSILMQKIFQIIDGPKGLLGGSGIIQYTVGKSGERINIVMSGQEWKKIIDSYSDLYDTSISSTDEQNINQIIQDIDKLFNNSGTRQIDLTNYASAIPRITSLQPYIRTINTMAYMHYIRGNQKHAVSLFGHALLLSQRFNETKGNTTIHNLIGVVLYDITYRSIYSILLNETINDDTKKELKNLIEIYSTDFNKNMREGLKAEYILSNNTIKEEAGSQIMVRLGDKYISTPRFISRLFFDVHQTKQMNTYYMSSLLQCATLSGTQQAECNDNLINTFAIILQDDGGEYLPFYQARSQSNGLGIALLKQIVPRLIYPSNRIQEIETLKQHIMNYL